MKRIGKFGWCAFLIGAPVLALLCSCTEAIEPEEVADVLLPVNVVTAAVTTEATTVTTTTAVTISPMWQENLAENYNYNGGVVIQKVPHYTQFTEYLTACESLASVSLLQYYGIDMDIDRFLDEYLPRADYPSLGEDGQLHGASPWEYFIGDPRDSSGFGCYNTCIAAGINKLAEGLAIPLDDVPVEELCATYIDKGQPVVFWGTIRMAEPYISEFHWVIPDGSLYHFVNPEHAVVLIGYDENYYYFSDSMSYETITPYAKAMVEKAYDGMFRQALAIDPLVLETLPDEWRMNTTAQNVEIE